MCREIIVVTLQRSDVDDTGGGATDGSGLGKCKKETKIVVTRIGVLALRKLIVWMASVVGSVLA